MTFVFVVCVCVEYAAVPYQTVVKIPSGVTFPEAAGISQLFSN